MFHSINGVIPLRDSFLSDPPGGTRLFGIAGVPICITKTHKILQKFFEKSAAPTYIFTL